MDLIDRELARGGGVVALRRLLQAGATRSAARRAVSARDLERVRPGWFAAPDADRDVRRAVAAGGALSCADALHRRGCWLPPSCTGVHARFAYRAARGRAGLIPHVLPPALDRPVLHSVDPAPIAAACTVGCLPRDDAVAVLDSALRLEVVDAEVLADLLRALGPRGTEVGRAIDPSAESGAETMLRLLLRGRRVRFRCQVWITGVERVDFVVGDRLVIEADSRTWHSKAADIQRDIDRTNLLRRYGFDVLRFTYHDIIGDPQRVAATILTAVRRGDHVWTRSNCTWRREGLSNPDTDTRPTAAGLAWASAW